VNHLDEWLRRAETARRLRIVATGVGFILWVVLFGLLGLVFSW
jgi:hypothetical protein